MKPLLLSVLTLSFIVLNAKTTEFVTVYREGRDFLVRSTYSSTHDLVIRMERGANETAYLLKKEFPITSWKEKGNRLRGGGDEYPATSPVGRYGILSGNHGSIYASILTIPSHNMTQKDIGSFIYNDKKSPFVIMDITDKDHILVHSPGKKSTLAPSFSRVYTKKLTYKGKALDVQAYKITQMYPLNRVTKHLLLADGKTPVPERKEIQCSFVDFYFSHDVIDPYEAVQSVIKNPGKIPSPRWVNRMHMFYLDTPSLQKKYPLYRKLPALMSVENHYRFDPYGAAVNYRKSIFHQPLTSVRSLDVMMNWRGLMAQSKKQYFYIPKLKKLKVPVARKKNEFLDYDFSAMADLRPAMPVSYNITRKDCLDPENPCDRFIRIAGNDKMEYGVALGYSLFMGATAKGKDQTRNQLYHLYRTKKMYPMAYELKNVKPGTVMETVSYKQSFNPQKEKDAVSYYYHFQGESLIVYADFHKKLHKKRLQLPQSAANRKITILEKTPGLTLLTKDRIGKDCSFMIDTESGNNYIVLKLDAGNKK